MSENEQPPRPQLPHAQPELSYLASLPEVPRPPTGTSTDPSGYLPAVIEPTATEPSAIEPAAFADGGMPAAPDEKLPPGLVQAMLADPVHAPERLALEAVRVVGPDMIRWAERVRWENPQASTGELAMHTRDKFIRLSQASGAATGALGLPGAAADTGFTAWTQARMILALAALHHLDPTDKERAAEILYFTGVYKAVSLAEKALAVTSGKAAPTSVLSDGQRSNTRAVAALTMSLARMLGKKAVKSLAIRAIPLGAIPVSAWSNGRSMRQLADQVVVEYAGRLGVNVHHHRQLKR